MGYIELDTQPTRKCGCTHNLRIYGIVNWVNDYKWIWRYPVFRQTCYKRQKSGFQQNVKRRESQNHPTFVMFHVRFEKTTAYLDVANKTVGLPIEMLDLTHQKQIGISPVKKIMIFVNKKWRLGFAQKSCNTGHAISQNGVLFMGRWW